MKHFALGHPACERESQVSGRPWPLHQTVLEAGQGLAEARGSVGSFLMVTLAFPC